MQSESLAAIARRLGGVDVDGTYGDNGAFWSCQGQYNSYFFAVGFQGCAQVIVYDRSTGQPPQSSSSDGSFNTCDPN
jgi:hypothetical protein